MSVMLPSTALETLANALRMITWLMALCVVQAPMMAIAMMEDAPHIMHSVWKLGVSGHSERGLRYPCAANMLQCQAEPFHHRILPIYPCLSSGIRS